MLAVLVGVAGQQFEGGLLGRGLHHVEDAVVRGDQRGQVRQNQLGHGAEVALALQHPAELGQVGLEPVLFHVLPRGVAEVPDHLVDVVLELRYLALGLDRDRPGQVALGHGGGHFGDGSDLGGEVCGQLVHVAGEVAPDAGRPRHPGLAAQLAVDADLAGHVRHLIGEGGECLRHPVDGIGQGGDLALHLHSELLLQVAVGHRGHHLRDAAHLGREVGRHRVHVVGQVLPDSGDSGYLGLASQCSLGTDLAGHAGHLRGERVELVHHRIHGVLQLENFALHVHRDLLVQLAPGHRGGHVGDVADLGRQVAGHVVHVVGQVLPGAGHALHVGLAAQLAFGADFSRDSAHLGGERVELVHHGIDGVLQLQNLALHVHRDLLREVAVGHRGGDLGNVPDLGGQVAGHRIHVVGQVLPHTGDAGHLRLAAQSAFGTDFSGDTGHFRGEGVELVHHRVDGVLELQNLALHIHRDLLVELSQRHRGRHVGDVTHLGREVAGHRVHVVGQVLPGAAHALHLGLAAQLALRCPLRGRRGSLPTRTS